MLRDALRQLIEDPSGKSKDCKLGKIIASQDKETIEIFLEALKSEASTMSLVRALKSEGISLSREYLGEKRSRCFKEGNPNCCLNAIDNKDAKK